MTYRHDVFVSYRRDPDAWTEWTRDHFKVLMRVYLRQDLARDPEIFVDERIDPGADWPNELAENLAASKVMVAVFSGDYFASPWCLHELDLMLGRLKATGGKARLIVPVIVHHTNLIPDEVGRVQDADFFKFRIAFMVRGTPLHQEFSAAMKALVPMIKKAIDTAPAFDRTWRDECKARFDAVYAAGLKGKEVPTRHFKPKPRPALLSNPRLVL